MSLLQNTISYWSQNSSFPDFPSLEGDIESEIVIIGSGIAGLTAAYLLLKEKKAVVILTSGNSAEGETCRTTAHLTYMLDDRFTELQRLFGIEGLKMALNSHKDAIDLIEKICSDENIDCDFERLDSHLFDSAETPSDFLYREHQALLHAGFSEATLDRSHSPFFKNCQVLTLPNQAQFHPLKYRDGLVAAILRMGGKIYQNAHVIEVKGGEICEARTNSSLLIRASSIIVATNTPINNRFIMHTKQAAYRSYVIASYIPKDSVPKALYYDTQDPYHYVRLYSEAQRDLIIVGGEDHKTGQEINPQACFKRLERWTADHFPMFKKVDYFWSGQIMEPVDALAFIGKNPLEKNLYLVTGDSGHGMTHGTLGGMINTDLICKRTSKYCELYDPSRKSFASISKFAQENLNVGRQYCEWLHLHNAPSRLNELPEKSGTIEQKHLKKVAVYKDEAGNLFEFSAVCPHLGCIVQWNDAEKTWDCPCHGSRFSCKGKVINGPSVTDLEPII